MKIYKNLNIKGTALEKTQLEDYMEKIASDQVLKQKSDRITYPLPRMKENYEVIENVYNMLRRTYKTWNPNPSGRRMAFGQLLYIGRNI